MLTLTIELDMDVTEVRNLKIRRRPSQEEGLACLATAFGSLAPRTGGELLIRQVLDHWNYPAAHVMDVLYRAEACDLIMLSNRAVGLVITLTVAGAKLFLSPLGQHESRTPVSPDWICQTDPLDQLFHVATQYMEVHGEAGLKVMAEQPCRIVAPALDGPQAWMELVEHIKKASG